MEVYRQEKLTPEQFVAAYYRFLDGPSDYRRNIFVSAMKRIQEEARADFTPHLLACMDERERFFISFGMAWALAAVGKVEAAEVIKKAFSDAIPPAASTFDQSITSSYYHVILSLVVDAKLAFEERASQNKG